MQFAFNSEALKLLDRLEREAERIELRTLALNQVLAALAHQIDQLSAAASSASSHARMASEAVFALFEHIKKVAAGVEEQAALSANLRGDSALSVEAVSALCAQANEISGFVEVIRRIANNTDLLALNAAIEAVRSGDAGAGFAVVAREVKALAGEAADATADISGVLEGLAARAASADQSLAKMSTMVTELGSATDSIAGAVVDQRTQGHTIVMQTEECAEEIVELLERVERLRPVTSEAATAASLLNPGMDELKTMLRRLRNIAEGDAARPSDGGASSVRPRA